MISTLPSRCATLALAGFFLSAPLAPAVFIFTETFSDDGDAEGWTGLSTGTEPTLAQLPATDVLGFATAGYTSLFLVADGTTSGGAFVGDFLSNGITDLKFDLRLIRGSDVDGLVVDLLDADTGEEWQYPLAVPALGSTASLTVPLSPGSAGWTQIAGSNSFAFILANTDELSFGLTSAAGGSVSGTLDNVSTVPEPTSALFALVAAVSLVRPRRRG